MMTLSKKIVLMILLALGVQFVSQAYDLEKVGTQTIEEISQFTKNLYALIDMPEAQKTAEWLDKHIAIDRYDGYWGSGLQNQEVADIAKIITADTTVPTKLTDLSNIITKCEKRSYDPWAMYKLFLMVMVIGLAPACK